MADSGSSSLFGRAMSGDMASLQVLLLRYEARVRRMIRRNLPAAMLTSEDVDDLLQETHVEVFRSIESIRATTEAEFVHWLMGVARHRVANARRAWRAAKRGGGRAVLPIDAPADASASFAPVLLKLLNRDERSPGSEVAARELTGRLLRQLEQLDSDQRLALRLRFEQDLGYNDIAAHMRRSADAVKMLVFRSLRRLKAGFTERSESTAI